MPNTGCSCLDFIGAVCSIQGVHVLILSVQYAQYSVFMSRLYWCSMLNTGSSCLDFIGAVCSIQGVHVLVMGRPEGAPICTGTQRLCCHRAVYF